MVVGIFSKLSKIELSIGSFTADLCRFSWASVRICVLSCRLGTRSQIQAFQGFFRTVVVSKDFNSLVS